MDRETATQPTNPPFCTQSCVQKRDLHAKARFWRVVVPPLTTASFRLCIAKNTPFRDPDAEPSDGKVGICVAQWEKVGYGGITNRPEWRGSSHSATPV